VVPKKLDRPKPIEWVSAAARSRVARSLPGTALVNGLQAAGSIKAVAAITAGIRTTRGKKTE